MESDCICCISGININISDLIENNNIQIQALEAYKDEKLSEAELATLSSLRELIEDQVDLKINYADIHTLKRHTLISGNVQNDEAINIFKESLVQPIAKGFITFDELNFLCASLADLPEIERSFFTVRLNAKKYWPSMLSVLVDEGSSFKPVVMNGHYYLVMPSFSIRKLFIMSAFGDEQLNKPCIKFGGTAISTLLSEQKNGFRILGYNFPGKPLMLEADLNYSGKYLFTEHDWSHLEESSMVPLSERKLLSKFNELAMQNLYGFGNEITLNSLFLRLFRFGDMEFSAYKLTWKMMLSQKKSKKHIVGYITKNKNSYILAILLETLFLPVGYFCSEIEMKSIMQDLGLDTKRESISLKKGEIRELEKTWYAQINNYIKKLICDCVINQFLYRKKYGFSIFDLDFLMEKEVTHEILSLLKGSDVKWNYFAETHLLKRSVEKLYDYVSLCKEQYNVFKEKLDPKKISWRDPAPDFSFQLYKVNVMEFFPGLGMKVRGVEVWKK